MKTIVVAVDETDPSRRALERAAMLAKAFDSHLIVTSVVPTEPSAAARSVGPDPVEPEAEHRAELASARRYLEGESVSAEYMEALGHEGQAIVTVARERSADLIVIGTRQPPLLVRLLGNAVSDVVTHHARCDVMIVH